jgi:hypothetical protein
MENDLSFAFDASKDSPEGARKRRAVAEAMMNGGQQMPQDVGQGIASLGSALAQRKMQRGAFPEAPTAPGGTAPGLNVGDFLGKHLGFSRGGLY